MNSSPLEFNLFRAPLDCRNLIEASAGTGKTYALSGLFLRFILEKKISIGEILAVTFTEAAAEELRGRIHSLLLDAKKFLEYPDIQTAARHALLAPMLSQCDKRLSLDLISNALRNFDSCSIFTIHGFCQRLLYEFAYESDQPLYAELIADQSKFVDEIVEDFWRRHFSNASILFSAFLTEKKIFPANLVKLVSEFIGSHDVRILPQTIEVDTKDAEDRFLTLFHRVAELWNASKAEIASILQSPSLDGRKYGKCISTMLRSLDPLLSGDAPDPGEIKNYAKLTTSSIRQSTKNGSPFVKHHFFDIFETLANAAEALCDLFNRRVLHLKSCLMVFVRQELAIRKKRDNVLYFDDLLLQVRLTLMKKKAGGILAELLQKKFHAVLIDEFQDTDPIQCGIFFDLFSKNTALFLIGDPKQAIYGFRGADIFSYLKASRSVDRFYTLSINYRSEKKLVNAINAIFGSNPKPFLFDDISYRHISANEKRHQFSLQDHENSRFIIWLLQRNESKSEVAPISKSSAETQVGNSIALEISHLLNSTNNGRLCFSGKKISPHEIAILVRTNREAKIIYNLLINNSIAATIYGNSTVFNTFEAVDLFRLLKGITNILNLDLIRASLCTCYLGYNANDINRLYTNQTEMDQLLLKFNDYHELWKNGGFERMIRFFMIKEKVRIRLLSMPLGERKLTNFLHLVELLHKEESETKINPKNLCNWLLNKILQNELSNSEEEILRLERDENAVKIMTFHKSKGLEFPIVFCPFPWEGSENVGRQKINPFLFHDPDDNYLQKIALGENEIHRFRTIFEKETLAENIRLLYVGLTRAKYACYCVWGMVSNAETSAFAYLFHGTNKTSSVQALGARLRGMTDVVLRNEIQKVVNNSEGAISLEIMPNQISRNRVSIKKPDIKLIEHNFNAIIPEKWHIASFSSITHFRGHEDYPLDLETNRNESAIIIDKKNLLSQKNDEFNIFSFPKGKNAGLFLHDILENIDFNNVKTKETENIIYEKLNEYDFNSLWFSTINTLINNLLTISLNQDIKNFTLNSIDTKKSMREMEFIFPMKRISSKQLNDIFIDTIFGKSNFLEKKTNNLDFIPIQGFMKGFIDLICEFEGKYYIFDWKSNYLGNSTDHYNFQAIKEEMSREFYYVQYHLYLIALNEFLSKKLPNYDYNNHFGGIFYIFLRGIHPDNGKENGIFFDRPNELTLNKLRNCLF